MADRDRRPSHDHDHVHYRDGYAPRAGGGTPGKSTLTSRLSAPAQTTIVFRVENAEAARAIADSLSPSSRDANGVRGDAEQTVQRAASTSGRSLPGGVRERFESSVGADLGSVRVHTGPESAAAAEAVGARAYAVGQDIHFAEGEYRPEDPMGLRLLAHEVAHTVQQAGSAPRRQNKLAVSSSQDAAELEADRAADAMVGGSRASITGVGGAPIAREADESNDDDDKGEGPKQQLSENDKAFMRSQSGLLDAAKVNVEKLAKGVQAYVKHSNDVFSHMEDCLKAMEQRAHEAAEEVNTILRMGAKDQAGRAAIVSAVIDAAMAPISSHIGGMVQQQFSKGNEAIKQALAEWPDTVSLPGATTGSLLPDMGDYGGNVGKGKAQGWAEGKAQQAANEAASGDSGSGSSVDGGGPDRAAFWQSIARHRAKLSSLTLATASAALAGTRIGEVKGAIDTVISIGISRPDYSMDSMAADAMAYAAGAQVFQQTGASVEGMAQSLDGALMQMQAAAPDMKEVQKRLVQDFLAKYKSNVDLITEEKVQELMRKRGFFQSLGIDIEELDSIFNGDEEDVTRAMARAQQMVTAKAGTAVVVKGTSRHLSVEIPGVGELPARLEAGNVGWVPLVRAVLTGSEATMTPSPKDIEGVTAAIDVRARHLIENRFVRVVLKSYEDLSPQDEEQAGSD